MGGHSPDGSLGGVSAAPVSRRSAIALFGSVLIGGCVAACTGRSDASAGATTTSASPASTEAASFFDTSKVHAISMQVDSAALKTMLQTYVSSGDKDWIKAGVTIDGRTFSDVGIKLKGNSSLRGATVDSKPEDLPWRIRLDKYVKGQTLGGDSDFTVRANAMETSLNEAVALVLLRAAGFASEDAVETRFSVNGSAAALRLTLQNLDDTWVAAEFPDAGKDSVLYKSDSDGNWSWRGDGGDYSTSFDIEAGKDGDYAPVIALLDLVDNGTAAQIAEKLPTMLDVDSLARYLAFEDLIDNFDDIDGPGNNSYLFYDSATKKFTVVAWDHNLAFGASPAGGPGGGGGGQGGGGRGGAPGGANDGGGFPGGGGNGGGGNNNGGGGRGGMSGNNPLVTAFKANAEWMALYTKATADLKAELFTSGLLTKTVDSWSAVITADASDLVPAATVTSEAATITKYASGS